MINILYEDNHLLVVVKPANIAVQADESKDQDLLSLLKEDLKIRYDKPGNVFLGLVHRLDRPVGGVMVFAKTSKAASRLSEQLRLQQMKKEYVAILKGQGLPRKGTLKDCLWKNEKENKVFIVEHGKEAILHYEVVEEKQDLTFVQITLETGRSHQIRVQFAHSGYPLYGDQKYDMYPILHQQICLFCFRLSFFHPVTKQWLTFEAPRPTTHPWDLF